MRMRFLASLAMIGPLLARPVHAEERSPDAPPSNEPPSSPSSAGIDGLASEPSTVTEAREAFRLASALAKQRRWAEALAAYQKSARLMPHPITTYDVAFCERALGRYARAYVGFSAALEPPASPEGAALPPDVAARAQTYRAEAEQRVARVTVTLVQRGLELRVDGVPLEVARPAPGRVVYVTSEDPGQSARRAATANEAGAPKVSLPPSFELWLDPGSHTFVASDAQGDKVVESHAFGTGVSAVLSLSVDKASEPAPPVIDAPPVAEKPSAEIRSADYTPAIVAFGVGAAGFVASGVFAALSLSEKSSLDDDGRCNERLCPDEAQYREQQSRMRLFADIATVGFAIGAIGTGVGAYFWLTAKPSGSNGPNQSGAPIGAWLGLRAAGISGRF